MPRKLAEWMTGRHPLSWVAMLAGVLLLGYVALQYYTMYSEQRRLARTWEAQQQQLSAAAAQPQSAPDDGLVKLMVPRIELEAIVVNGTSDRDLLVGPGRVEKTAVPGENGNAVITAHRDTFFRRIFDLEDGDHILVQRNGRLFRFAVTGKKIVMPSDVSVLKPTQDAQLTLITCYPPNYIGPAPERYVIFSALVSSEPAPVLRKASAAAASE